MPKTEPQMLGFRVFGPNPAHWPCVGERAAPPTASISSSRIHQLTASPHIAVSHGVSETEPQTLSFRFFGPNPAPWPRVGERAAPPLPPSHQLAPTNSQHHPILPFHMACLKPSHGRSVFDFLAQIPPPGLTLANTQPSCRLHLINPHPPPPSIVPHHRFTWNTRNRAMNTRFCVFGPKPRPPGA